MFNRRDFLSSMFGTAAVTLPSLKNDGIERILSAVAGVDGRSPEEVASDEDFWFQVQQAFTLDRTIVNLNNGGVCPSPRVVLDAQIRMLQFSNQAPVYHMWRILEPGIESVRTQLARTFGCDREEMAITRNASEALENVQLGLDLEPGDEVLTTDQDYGRMLTTWDQRRRRDSRNRARSTGSARTYRQPSHAAGDTRKAPTPAQRSQSGCIRPGTRWAHRASGHTSPCGWDRPAAKSR